MRSNDLLVGYANGYCNVMLPPLVLSFLIIASDMRVRFALRAHPLMLFLLSNFMLLCFSFASRDAQPILCA